MADNIGTRLKNAWNAFTNRDPPRPRETDGGSSYRPDKIRYRGSAEKSIVTAVSNKIALDCAAIDIVHAKLDKAGRYTDEVDSDLNNCLTNSANLDQSSRAFKIDLYNSLFDEGCIAIVPVEADTNADRTSVFDVSAMRVGKVVQWYPRHVRVRVYNEASGRQEEITLPKTLVCIIENPLYAVMNEPNSVAQRLRHKLSLLDISDENTASGKLDMIIQLPYVIKTEARRAEANKRRVELEDQLANSKYGIGYVDGTERIIQLNRPVENNLMNQVQYLTEQYYSQLGITQEIMNGTANDATMQNYYTRTIEPIVSAVVEEMRRKWITKTARSQGKSILFFRDPFKLVPATAMAEIADKFTRNEIMSSNEIRQIVGLKPSTDPKADELRNSNINSGEDQQFANTKDDEKPLTEENIQNGI